MGELRAIVGIIFELLIFPMLIGQAYLSIVEKKKEPGIMVYGYCLMFAFFLLIISPMIYWKISLKNAAYVWIGISLSLSALALIYIKNLIQTLKEKWKRLMVKKIQGILFILFLVCVIAFSLFCVIPKDNDQTIITSVMAWQTNTMFVYNPYTGQEYMNIPAIAQAPISMFYAVIAKIIGIHPTILAKMLLSAFFILLCMEVYILLSTRLFDKNSRQRKSFIWIIVFLFIGLIFTNINEKANILQSVWTGESLLVNLLIPFCLYIILELNNKIKTSSKYIRKYYISIFLILVLDAKLFSVNGGFYIIFMFLVFILLALIEGGRKIVSGTKFDSNNDTNQRSL